MEVSRLGVELELLSYLVHLPSWVTLFFFFFCLFRAVPGECRSAWVRGRTGTGAAAASLHHHSHTRSEPCLQPTPQPTETPDP